MHEAAQQSDHKITMTDPLSDSLIIETVERLCQKVVPSFQHEQYYNSVPRDLYTELSNIGLAGLAISENFGGLGSSAMTNAKVFETMARYDLGPAIFVSVHAMVAGLIERHGSSEQRQSFLPKLASGEQLAAFALTEPHAGSDAAALSTFATPTADGFSIKGSKCYITSAGFADLYLVFARTDTNNSSDISAFLVPAETPGLSIGKPERKMGCELSPIASLFFDDMTLPKSALLGPLHQGFKVALSGLAGGRVNIAACAIGIATAALAIAVEHLKQRSQFGRPLADLQGLQFMVADMHMQLEAARLLTYKAADLMDKNGEGLASREEVTLAASSAKCFATDAAMQITTDAVQLLGGAGYIKEYTVEKLMRDAKMLQIVEGANQVQRMLIARQILK